MKKIVYVIVAVVALLAGTSRAEAIEPQFAKGTMIGAMNLGIDWARLGANVTFDYVLVDSWWKGHFTVGGEMDFSHWTNISENNFCIMPRATYGLNITDAFEVHVGLAEGLGFWNYPDTKTKGTSLSSSEFVGLRFFLNDSFGFSAEAGYANFLPYLRGGIALKF